MMDNDDVFGDEISDRSGMYRPALGPAWYHCVTSRVVLSTAPQRDMDTGEEVRQLQLTKSPISGNVRIRYTIEREGIVTAPVPTNDIDMF